MSMSVRIACLREELERYKKTLEYQRRRENSFLHFQQKKFASRQEKILGKSFQASAMEQESSPQRMFPRVAKRPQKDDITKEKKMSDSNTRLSGKLDGIQDIKFETRRRDLSAGCTISLQLNKEKENEGSISKERKIVESQKEQLESGDLSEEIVKIFELGNTSPTDEFPKRRLVKQNNFISFYKTNEEFKEKSTLMERYQSVALTDTIDESRPKLEQQLRTPRNSFSLPDIVSSDDYEEHAERSDITKFNDTKKVKKSKKNRFMKQWTQPNGRTSSSLAKFSSLPDVHSIETSEQKYDLKALKSEKIICEGSSTLPRVTTRRRQTKVMRPSKTEGSVNFSVVCRVIRLKNTLVRRNIARNLERCKREIKKEEEITPEVWDSLKSCRYLRIAN